MDNNSQEYAYMENFSAMLIKLSKRSKSFRNYFYSDKLVDKINKWLGSHVNPPINSTSRHSGVFKNNK